ncbi:MAG: 2-oxoacid:acceptor oxidoreductase family protein [Syntrophobacterales bacterium]|jgi:indolepyruvate ferredoxin oxidoreductase beta subunit|nr:2-oxoacid:acceptor oxidoreductase family protein [Syntrophobacterales bacterium]
MNLEIVCAGIGGRGVLMASTILMETAIKAGLSAMASDEYGMSQRGGSVVSLVKIGNFRSPLIGAENAGILLAFEESEFYRNLRFLGKGALVVINTDKKKLPDAVTELLMGRKTISYLIDADALAKQLGMIQASNMAVLGFFSRLAIAPYTEENIMKTIGEKVHKRVAEKNLEVFREGCAWGDNLRQYRKT